MTVGQRLRRRRKELGLSQQKLAAPNYTHAYVSTIESDKAAPSKDALTYFANKLGMTLDELATGRPPDLEARLQEELQSARRAVSAGHQTEAAKDFARIAREAERYDLPYPRAQAEIGGAIASERMGRLEEAVERCEKAESVLKGLPPAARAEAVAVKARCLQAIGDTRYAAYILVSAIDELGNTGDADPTGLARLHASLMAVFFELGLYRKAGESVGIALELAPKVADSEHLANLHLNVARVLLEEGRFEEAQRSLSKALELFTDLDLRTEMGRAHFARGYILSRKPGHLEEALEEFDVALKIFKNTRAKLDEARVAQELARIKRMHGEADEAIGLLTHSISLLGDCPNTGALAFSYRELGACQAEIDPSESEKHLRTSIELFERADEAIEVAATYRLLGDLLVAQGRMDDGSEAFRSGLLGLEPPII